MNKEELENLLDNFRIILIGYAFSIDKNDVGSIHEIKQMAKYYKEQTGNELKLITKWGEL